MADRDSICVPGEKLDDSFREIIGATGYYVRRDGTTWSSWASFRNELGQIRRVRTDTLKKLASQKNKQGYHLVNITRSSGNVYCMLSRMMLRVFVSEPPTPKHCACHCDGNKDNNAIDNLRWDTRSGNEADKLLHGTSNRGARNGMAKLTESQVREIRELYLAIPIINRQRPNGAIQSVADVAGLSYATTRSALFNGWIDVAGGPIRRSPAVMKECDLILEGK